MPPSNSEVAKAFVVVIFVVYVLAIAGMGILIWRA